MNIPRSRTLSAAASPLETPTISMLPASTTKTPCCASPRSKRTSPGPARRCSPNAASRAICASLSLGNIDSFCSGASATAIQERLPQHNTTSNPCLRQESGPPLCLAYPNLNETAVATSSSQAAYVGRARLHCTKETFPMTNTLRVFTHPLRQLTPKRGTRGQRSAPDSCTARWLHLCSTICERRS